MKSARKSKHQVNRNGLSDLWIASIYRPEKGKRLAFVDNKTWLEVSAGKRDRTVKSAYNLKYSNKPGKIFKIKV
jgi:hypothetical protein